MITNCYFIYVIAITTYIVLVTIELIMCLVLCTIDSA